jgi:hypothetical protein
MARDDIAGPAGALVRSGIALAAALVWSDATAQVAVPRPSRPIIVPGPIYPVPAPAVLAEYYGAIAYFRASGAFGYSYDYATARDAGIAAINACGASQCVVVVGFKNGCGILVDGPGGPAIAEGVTAQEAEVKARARCVDPQCQVIAWACTR